VHTFSLSEYASSLSVTLARTELSWDGAMPLDSRIISEVGWGGVSALMIKEIDRAARRGSAVVFQDGEARGRIVRKLGKNGEEGDDGWIDHVSEFSETQRFPKDPVEPGPAQGQNVVPVKSPEGYLDIVPKEGYNHLAFFSPVDASEPVWLTSGDWEVTEISGMDETASTA
jgi:dipeptidyl aminopeptidase